MMTTRATSMATRLRAAARARRGLSIAVAALPLLGALAGPAEAGYGAPERIYLRWSGPVPALPGNSRGRLGVRCQQARPRSGQCVMRWDPCRGLRGLPAGLLK